MKDNHNGRIVRSAAHHLRAGGEATIPVSDSPGREWARSAASRTLLPLPLISNNIHRSSSQIWEDRVGGHETDARHPRFLHHFPRAWIIRMVVRVQSHDRRLGFYPLYERTPGFSRVPLPPEGGVQDVAPTPGGGVFGTMSDTNSTIAKVCPRSLLLNYPSESLRSIRISAECSIHAVEKRLRVTRTESPRI